MLERLKEIWRGPGEGLLAGAATPQVGVIPYAMRGGVVVFLLVTTRRTGRWIFPKGRPERGETPQVCAAREAWEEAGVDGAIDGPPVGVYRDRKIRPNRPAGGRRSVIEVEMYPFHVTQQREDWPEAAARERHWATLEEARKLLTTPGLVELAERAEAQILAARQGADSVPGQKAEAKVQ